MTTSSGEFSLLLSLASEAPEVFALVVRRLDDMEVGLLSHVCRALRPQYRSVFLRQFVRNTLRLNTRATILPQPTPLRQTPFPLLDRFYRETRSGDVFIPRPSLKTSPVAWEHFPGEFDFAESWILEEADKRDVYWQTETWKDRRRAFVRLCHGQDAEAAARACGALCCERPPRPSLKGYPGHRLWSIHEWWPIERFGYCAFHGSVNASFLVHPDSETYACATRGWEKSRERHSVLVYWEHDSSNNASMATATDVPRGIESDALFWLPGEELVWEVSPWRLSAA